VSLLNTNEDADLVIATGGTIISAATFSTGADIVRLSATIGSLKMGNGHDTVSGSTVNVLTGGSINLGDGRDTLQISTLTGGTAVSILGDNGQNFNADLIDLGVGSGMNGLTIKGQGGNDSISVSGVQASSLIQGNKGTDSIALSSTFVNGLTLGAGQGNDTIYLDEAFVASVSGDIFGGEGNDSIFINGAVQSGVDATAINIFGGAGSDTITVDTTTSGAMGAGEYGTLVLSSLSDSTLGSLDLFQIISGSTSNTLNVSGQALITVDYNNSASVNAVGQTSAAALFSNATAYVTIDASGVATFNGSLATDVQSSVTAAMASLDTVTTNEGAAAIFTVDSNQYLFMQGGTAGISDDSLIQFWTSANKIAVAGSAIAVTFSGL
jgi:S-layer protein